MIKEVNHACQELNKKLGVSVSLPAPKREALEAASVCHFLVGAGLVAAGVALPARWCAVLGGISLISSAVLRHERSGRKNDHPTKNGE